MRIVEALQEEQRVGVRLLQKHKRMLVFESRQAVRKMKDCPVVAVEFTKVSSLNLGHRQSALTHMQLRGRRGVWPFSWGRLQPAAGF